MRSATFRSRFRSSCFGCSRRRWSSGWETTPPFPSTSGSYRPPTGTSRKWSGGGAFREDLFYRINVIPIHIPPLRDRLGDISLLADFFFRRIQLKSGKKIRGISDDAMRLLTEYSWPGNVREMKSAFEFAFVSCQEEVIFPGIFRPPSAAPKRVLREAPETEVRLLVEGVEKRRRLIEALDAAAGNQSQAARILGVSRVTVWHWMKKYDIGYERNLKRSK